MIIGYGLLANAFALNYANRLDIIIFASGVSNSQEQDLYAFRREELLLKEQLSKNKKLVYFSTCSIYDPKLCNSPYVKHKLRMEALVCKSKNYSIFRLPQVIGKTKNPNTLTNFIYNKILSGEPFHIWANARRNLIDVVDVAKIADSILQSNEHSNSIINLACTFSTPTIDIVKIFESILDTKASYEVKNDGAEYTIDTRLSSKYAKELDIDFHGIYLETVIRKYYDSSI